MIKLKELLVERIDYQDTAKMLVKHYGLRSKVKIGKVKGQNEADYDWVKDVINLKRSYPNVKEFIVSVLHEIDHAKMRKKMGVRKYEWEYIKAGEEAEAKGTENLQLLSEFIGVKARLLDERRLFRANTYKRRKYGRDFFEILKQRARTDAEFNKKFPHLAPLQRKLKAPIGLFSPSVPRVQ